MAESLLAVLVDQARAGDTRAFDALVRRYQDAAIGYARSLLRDPAAAEDAAQEAFVQAWKELPRLATAAAFGGWLRRIVFKYCDRALRSQRGTAPLPYSLPAPREDEPAAALERAERSARVREALADLPEPLRAVTFLYYLSGHDVKEVASFLEVPASTVKNRLLAARRRLRKELWEMADTMLKQDQPSRNDEFAGAVLARVLREYRRQKLADPHTVDRGLLDQGRAALFDLAGVQGPLSEEAVRDGFLVLWRKQDFAALSALLMRYLRQAATDSESAWAYVHLGTTIAMSGSAAGAVMAHEAFERWLPGHRPCLSTDWPYYPVPPDATDNHYEGDEVQLLYLGQSGEFTTSYLACWRNDDYLAKVDAALSDIPATPRNRFGRFFMLRMATNACDRAANYDRSAGYVLRMHALADECDDAMQALELRAKALGHDLRLARERGDEAACASLAERLADHLDDAVRLDPTAIPWVRGERHNLACELIWAQRYELALRLFETSDVSGGYENGYGWMVHAAATWHVTHDRERTLQLLREARAHDDRDMTDVFAMMEAFADVKDDPEFLEAVSPLP